MVKIYFDASVIIAALLSPTGGSAKLIEFVKLGEIIGITSQTVIEEIEEHTLKISKTSNQIRQFIQDNRILVREKINRIEEIPFLDLVNEEDVHVVAGAKLTKCNYLVTLDKKHLLKDEVSKVVRPLKVVNPKEYLERIV